MAHFAQLDENNIVQQVLVVGNADILVDGVEQESKGIEFLKSLLGQETNWVQTSYNKKFRKHYAGIGFTYDAVRDAFIQPQPYPSWTLNEDTCDWEPPTPYPADGNAYLWNEETLTWDAL